MMADAHGIDNKSLHSPELSSLVALSSGGQKENMKLGHLARHAVREAAGSQILQIAIARIILRTMKRIWSVRQETWIANVADREAESQGSHASGIEKHTQSDPLVNLSRRQSPARRCWQVRSRRWLDVVSDRRIRRKWPISLAILTVLDPHHGSANLESSVEHGRG
jgi:hypothetical protein